MVTVAGRGPRGMTAVSSPAEVAVTQRLDRGYPRPEGALVHFRGEPSTWGVKQVAQLPHEVRRGQMGDPRDTPSMQEGPSESEGDDAYLSV